MRVLLPIFLSLLIAACGRPAIDAERYRDAGPAFDPRRFFDGDVRGWGIVQNRDGDVVQRFTVDIVGRVDDESIVLDETFHYEVGDGPTTRVWTLTPTGADTFTGEAGDILGKASGRVSGNALEWRYAMDLPVDDTTYRVDFVDWMWRFNDGSVVNRSYIKKFGLVMAEVTLFFQRQ